MAPGAFVFTSGNTLVVTAVHVGRAVTAGPAAAVVATFFSQAVGFAAYAFPVYTGLPWGASDRSRPLDTAVVVGVLTGGHSVADTIFISGNWAEIITAGNALPVAITAGAARTRAAGFAAAVRTAFLAGTVGDADRDTVTSGGVTAKAVRAFDLGTQIVAQTWRIDDRVTIVIQTVAA